MIALVLIFSVSLFLALVLVILFTRACTAGQFDDLETPGIRVLTEDLDEHHQIRR